MPSWTCPDFKPHDKPVTLGDIRAHQIRHILIYCGNPACTHSAQLNADQWPDDMTLGALQPRMVCLECGHRGGDVRPAWLTDARRGR